MKAIHFKSNEFKIKNKAAYRANPEIEFNHRLKTRAHLNYISDEKLFDVSDGRWAKATIDGEVCYAHEYHGCVLVLRLKTSDNKFNLSHNHDGSFDRHLLDNPGENLVYSITSSNNGLESTTTFSLETAGISAMAAIMAGLAFCVSLASAMSNAIAAEATISILATITGDSVAITSIVGIAIAVLAFIGLWIAYSVGREIVLNLIYENRSSKTIKLVDHYVYNIGDNTLVGATLAPLESVPPFEFYSDVAIQINNYSKIRGVGVSLKFQKEDGSFLVICIRNDIYHDPHYTIQTLEKDNQTTAEMVYDECTSGDLINSDFPWGGDLIVKNCLDPSGFMKYNFSGIISFHDSN